MVPLKGACAHFRLKPRCEQTAPFTQIFALFCLVLLLGGCARREPALPSALEQVEDSGVELSETVFFPQKAYQCGPAALATLLVHGGKDVSPDDLTGKIFLPEREGSLQMELVAAVRAYDLIPYLIEPSLSILLAELRAGRPVLVLQNVGLASIPQYHYAVVIGYATDDDTIILRSGTERRQIVSARRFLESWQQAGGWAMLALRPGEMPANPDQYRYLETVTILEEIGQFETALSGYQAAFRFWPDLDSALLGIGNCYYGLVELVAAGDAYRRLTEQFPENIVAYNNLAHVLGVLGQYAEALTVIERGERLVEGRGPAQQMFEQTRDEVLIRRALEESSEE
ncbi:MAG: PA2778 family cysteine peptidase [Thermodesulfobacteriota bacterium]